MFLRLSHTLRLGGPGLGRVSTLAIEPRTSIARGDGYHSFILHLYNHDGTHVDAPYHFNPQGKRIAELETEDFIFDRPFVAEVPKSGADLIRLRDLQPYQDSLQSCDLLLLRTGYCRFRESDQEKYMHECPCIAPETARYLVERCPQLRAVGIDAVSIGSTAFPEQTVISHRILTGHPEYSSRHVLIFEDVNLDFDLSRMRRVIAMPLFVEQIDGAPCTMLAEIG